MQPDIKFNLLLQNDLLKSYHRLALQSNTIKNAFGHDIMLPQKHSSIPFIFSCFALSIDGKLCYPDTSTGLDIALANKNASTEERMADWLSLMVARSISDLVILSSNIFKKNSNRKSPTLAINDLKADRITNNKLDKITPIIFCRDLNSLDFAHEMFLDSSQPFLILHQQKDLTLKQMSSWNQQNISTFKRDATKIKHLLYIDRAFTEIFKLLNSCGYNVILNESPFFHHKLLEEQLLNELWLNYSCSYIGGHALSLGDKQRSFTTKNHPDTEILALYNINYNFLYSRQLIKYTSK